MLLIEKIKNKTKLFGDWIFDADFENWTDPVKLPAVFDSGLVLPAVFVTGLTLGMVTLLQDPKGAPACKRP
jgi:hypothetical protein